MRTVRKVLRNLAARVKRSRLAWTARTPKGIPFLRRAKKKQPFPWQSRAGVIGFLGLASVLIFRRVAGMRTLQCVLLKLLDRAGGLLFPRPTGGETELPSGAKAKEKAEEKKDEERRKLAERAESWAGVIGSLGLASVLIVIIGRLWTRTYFDHFGLPSSGMEFSLDDFAFRSLEALIMLVLGAIGFSAAWLMRDRLRRWGFLTAAAELILVGLFVAGVWFLVPVLPDSLLATTGVLGLSSGLALAAMVWFGVDVWAGPGGGVKKWPDCVKKRLEKRLGDGALDKLEEPVENAWRVLAVVVFLAIGFAYLPAISERLASTKAIADVATGRFAAAILESSEHPLPDAIASSDDPTKSNPVRVILTQSQNTYVLHSTDCTTIGELDVGTSVEGFLPVEAPEVCKVFTIPTARLKSIEYFQVSGKAPPNESMLRPIPVALGDTPFEESFSSGGASDEEELSCGLPTEGKEGTDFFNSVWFEFTPATDGAVLSRVETAEFRPAVGIWAAPQGAIDVQLVVGSGGEGLACEAEAATVPEPAPEPDAEQERTKDVVGAVANVRANTRYVASIGAQDNRGGLGSVSFEFWAGGYFSDSAIAALRAQALEGKTVEEGGNAGDLVCQAQELMPRVEIVSGVGEAELELWRLDPNTYELQCLADIPEDERRAFLKGGFALESGEKRRPFAQEESQDEQKAMVLHAPNLAEGVWTLALPEGFVGLTRLTGTSRVPDLMLAFADTSGTPLEDARVQQAVLVVLEESGIREELGYGGNVVFDPESFEERLQVPQVIEDREFAAHMLLQGEGYEEGFPIQIQVEGESETLNAAAESVRQRLVGIGLDARIEPCTDACIRVFFRTGDQG